MRVALGWLWVRNWLPTACLPNGFEVALSWLWVACSPSSLKVRGSTFDVRRSASGRNLKHSKAGFRPSAVSLAYITRPVGGWRGPKLSPASLPCMSGESPMTLSGVSSAPIIGSAYATGPSQRHLSPRGPAALNSELMGVLVASQTVRGQSRGGSVLVRGRSHVDRARLCQHATYDVNILPMRALICTVRGWRSPGAGPASPPCGLRKPLALKHLWAYHWRQVRRTLHFH
jgi:hypothetical protein